MLPLAEALPEDLDRFFTTTVALITTRSSKGDNVMAAEWTFNVSYDPMLVAVVVSPRHATHAAILESKEFGVNMASEEQFALASFAGGFSAREADKLTSAALRTRPGARIGAPMVEGALAQIECKLVSAFEVGDHTQFVGQAVAARVDPARRPLALYQGYRTLGPKVVRGEHVFVTITPEGEGAVRVDGFYYADVRGGQAIALAAFDALGARVAQGEAVSDRGGFFEWRPSAPRAAVARVTARAGTAEGEARARPV